MKSFIRDKFCNQFLVLLEANGGASVLVLYVHFSSL